MVAPKKHLGQHFLTDQFTAKRIVDSLNSTERVLEIGPGKGILTNYLKELPDSQLQLVEIDIESVAYLFKNFPDIKVLNRDFLKLDLETAFDGKELSIIGNFPYNISTQIVFKILDNRSHVVEMVGMFQREVAERICSDPGSKEYGILSVLGQMYYKMEFLFGVKEGVFFPKPKVKSAVIRMTRKENVSEEIDYLEMKKFVKAAFNQRRKQLKNTVAGFLPIGFTHPLLVSRPEQLSHGEFTELLLSIKKFKS